MWNQSNRGRLGKVFAEHPRLPSAPAAAYIIGMNLQRIAPTQAGPPRRLLFLDALRAFASMLILWHHFALYPPLSMQAEPLLGPLVHWFSEYARSTQVFFVIGGYVMARSMSGRNWNSMAVGSFIARRYCRLGIPYLAAIVLAIVASALGRGWLPENVTGTPPSVPQFFAHVFFTGLISSETP
jgi:peptidoglycan/LPS O-acetylase OafA/YrhL